jgi:hypothetical protein
MYAFLDKFFLLFHASWILFILTGWIWRRSRRLHLAVIVLTSLSWFGLGMFYGIGYCPLTAWHWSVKRALGEVNLPNSYTKYYLDRWTSGNWNPHIVDLTVLLVGLAAFAASLTLNWLDARRSAVPRYASGGDSTSS